MAKSNPRRVQLKAILESYSAAVFGPDGTTFTNAEIDDILADIDAVDPLRRAVSQRLAAVMMPAAYRNPAHGKEMFVFLKARYPHLWRAIQQVLRNQ